MEVSPDGKNVYVAAYLGKADGVAVFDREPATGELTQKQGASGCFATMGGGPCRPAAPLAARCSWSSAPMARNVYVSSISTSSVAIFKRTG